MDQNEVLRALDALKAAWRGDDAALTAAVECDGVALPVLLAAYGDEVLRALFVTRAGVRAGMSAAELAAVQEAMELDVAVRMGVLLAQTLRAWAELEGGDPVMVSREISRALLSAMVSVTQSPSREDVEPMLEHLRAEAVAGRWSDEPATDAEGAGLWEEARTVATRLVAEQPGWLGQEVSWEDRAVGSLVALALCVLTGREGRAVEEVATAGWAGVLSGEPEQVRGAVERALRAAVSADAGWVSPVSAEWAWLMGPVPGGGESVFEACVARARRVGALRLGAERGALDAGRRVTLTAGQWAGHRGSVVAPWWNTGASGVVVDEVPSAYEVALDGFENPVLLPVSELAEGHADSSGGQFVPGQG
ncbi:hypothetical protein OHV05_36770 (plasmid) [Kitasatospora sp. NBC_00070]|uniref:hypothetical protein n=1 Tax=Kitasatospora sp. NBC_00070 TaxID=2975962 RepID=UPI002F90AD8D